MDGRDGAGPIGAVRAWKTLTAWSWAQGRSWSDFGSFQPLDFDGFESRTREAAEGGTRIF